MKRYNKNGILILDPPKQASQLQTRTCIPGEHRWRFVKTVDHSDRTDTHFECRNCTETMVETAYDDTGWY